MTADASYQPKVYKTDGGDRLKVASGGTIEVESGGSITVDGVTVDSSTLAVNGLTASATELNQYSISLDIADGSADAAYYVIAPHAGDIKKLWSVIDGAVGTADMTITPSIGGVDVTDGAITVAYSGSAAGDVDSATPSAANTVTAGQAIKLTVAGGGAGGSPRVHVAIVIER